MRNGKKLNVFVPNNLDVTNPLEFAIKNNFFYRNADVIIESIQTDFVKFLKTQRKPRPNTSIIASSNLKQRKSKSSYTRHTNPNSRKYKVHDSDYSIVKDTLQTTDRLTTVTDRPTTDRSKRVKSVKNYKKGV